MHNSLILRGLSKFAIFYTLFAINYCFRFVTFWYIKSYKSKLSHTQKAPPRAANTLKSPLYIMLLFWEILGNSCKWPRNYGRFCYFDRFRLVNILHLHCSCRSTLPPCRFCPLCLVSVDLAALLPLSGTRPVRSNKPR